VKRLLVPACVLFAAAVAVGDEKSGQSVLSPKQVADGWVALFDGKTMFGWQIDGEAKVENGELVLGGSKETTARPTTSFGQSTIQIDGTSGERFNSAGAFPLRAAQGQVLRISAVKLKPEGMRSLFNGKDLAGWKKFEANPARAKSEFTVEDGCIHLKNGPGDLQTEEQFDNFVLQVECRSNGPHLNSGVFFRCIPGLYQQGYECQIHNHFTPTPVREYVIEDYDPKTNELKNKTKVKYTAVDFGTGAIYRRVPARGPQAKDGEWFTMTIVADGRHLATWVNGIQETDWVDNRPLNDNARNGCKLGKGAISLQGHDKTTDLSFRNIRIESLGK
jgi:Domain of Unknown Function (DUF1080)